MACRQLILQKRMLMTLNWEKIPSIDNLKLDWDYEPENPLGKRSTIRLGKKQLLRILDKNSVPVSIAPIAPAKVLAKKSHENGYLIDLSEEGLAVTLDNAIEPASQVKVGFFLGKRKIIAKGIVRYVSFLAGEYRIGIEFVQISEENVSFIKSLHSSAIYKL